MSEAVISSDKLYTYQDLSAIFRVHVKTIYRWFRRRRGLFRPTHNTVRIPGQVVADYIRAKTK